MDDSLTAALVRLHKAGKLDLEQLASAATVGWWAWDALTEIAPDRVRCPRPERKRGRDTAVNLVRDVRIWGEVEVLHAMGWSLRKAYHAVAKQHTMLEWKAVEAVYRKERQRESA